MADDKEKRSSEQSLSSEDRDVGVTDNVDYDDVDEALRAYEGIDPSTIHLDAATARRLLWRIDLVLMPVMCFVYGFNFLDSTCFSSGPMPTAC